MKLAASELSMIAQTLAESTSIADRTDLPLFTWKRETRKALADKVLQLLASIQIECLQDSAGESQ